MYRFVPSIHELGLGEKVNRKKLQGLFEKYLRPHQNESKTLDIQKEWGRQFREGTQNISKKDMNDETTFIMDIIIYYLYYDIVHDR